MQQAKRIKPSPLVRNVFTGTEWQGGSQQEVTWSSQGDVPTVMVYIGTATDDARSIDDAMLLDDDLHDDLDDVLGFANTGSCRITVPTGLVPGEYRVRVASSASEFDVCAVSDIILIDHGRTPPVVSSVTAASAEWLGGSQQEVTWSSQGDVPEVNVLLFTADARSCVSCLHDNHANLGFANTGSCRITVPTGLVPGEYRVRVASGRFSHRRRDVSAVSGIIRIDHGRAPPAISNVTASSAEWLGGSQQEVTWSSRGDVPEVNIYIMDITAAGSIIPIPLHPWDLANTGSCHVTVPTGLVPGKYRVQVASSITDDVCAPSGIIRIDHGRTPPVVSNVAARQPIWHSGSQQEVSWSSQGDVPEVEIYITTIKGSRVPSMFADPLNGSRANTGSCHVTVPTGLVPGEYRVHVESSTTNKVYAHSSEAITIDDEHRERCVQYALGLLGLPHAVALPYQIIRKIAVMAASAQ
jgi:hypothetical protein